MLFLLPLGLCRFFFHFLRLGFFLETAGNLGLLRNASCFCLCLLSLLPQPLSLRCLLCNPLSLSFLSKACCFCLGFLALFLLPLGLGRFFFYSLRSCFLLETAGNLGLLRNANCFCVCLFSLLPQPLSLCFLLCNPISLSFLSKACCFCLGFLALFRLPLGFRRFFFHSFCLGLFFETAGNLGLLRNASCNCRCLFSYLLSLSFLSKACCFRLSFFVLFLLPLGL